MMVDTTGDGPLLDRPVGMHRVKRTGIFLGGLAAGATLAAAGCMSVGDFFAAMPMAAHRHLRTMMAVPSTRRSAGAVTLRYTDFGALNTDTLESYATP